jgi:putative DNA primase/helicase
MVAMHPWGEPGYVAFEEWSRTSTNPKHQNLTDQDLINKWSSVSHHTIGWAWLQAKAQAYNWQYETYSAEQIERIKPELQQTTSLDDIPKQLIKDSYLTAADTEKAVYIIQTAIALQGQKVTLTSIRNTLSSETTLDPRDSRWAFHLTDKGNVNRLAKLYQNELYFIPETKEFIVWENNKWHHRTNIQRQVFETIDQIPYMENRTITTDEEKQLAKWRHNCENITRIKALSTLVKDHEPLNLSLSDLNTHNTIIGTPSSILNLETGIEATNTPDHLITMHTSVDVIPDATCPRWDQFILEIMDGRQDLALFLQRLAGYCLHGGNPEQLFIILEGHGANGKTTFVNVLQHVFGNYAATAAADTLTRPAFNKSGSAAAPDIVRLYRKRLVICNEWNEGTYINESLVKVLSGGGDEIAVRALYSNRIISYSPEFVIMLATNHRPNISGMDYGIWRRLLIIPFDVNFTDAKHIKQRDPHLETYLKENEAQGIFNWLIEGYRQWQEQGIGTSYETGIPQTILDLKEEYKLDMDTVGQFLQERTLNFRDHGEDECKDYKTTSKDVYNAYRRWAEDNGHIPKGSKTLSRVLKEGGFKQVRMGSVRGFEGIHVLTPGELDHAKERLRAVE